MPLPEQNWTGSKEQIIPEEYQIKGKNNKMVSANWPLPGNRRHNQRPNKK